MLASDAEFVFESIDCSLGAQLIDRQTSLDIMASIGGPDDGEKWL
jgi:hypothetical protein